MSKLGFFSDPHVQYVSQVIDEILAGNLQIPRFQRPYLWDWDRRLDLFRSIQLGIPMGAIMIWRTSGEQLKTYRQFGTIRFKEPMPDGPQQYLLDGVQRLSTLLSALTVANADDLSDDESLYQVQDGDRVAYFDLEANDFIALKSSEEVKPYYMPLYLLSNSIAMYKFQRNLSGANVERWIPILDSLAKAFREYKIPVIPIVTDDIGLASQTFQRINSSGLQMGEKDMLHALTYSSAFDFSSELDDVRDSLDSLGWGKLDDDLMLRLVKASLSLDVYKSGVDAVSKAIRHQPKVLRNLEIALKDAARFFWEKLNIPSPDFVPYSFHIVGITEAFRFARETQKAVPDGLEAWVWLTTYLEYFTGLSGDKVSAQLEAIRRSVKSGTVSPVLQNFNASFSYQTKQKFDFRTARSRAFTACLVRLMNTNTNDRQGTELIRKFGRAAVISGFPRDVFKIQTNFLSPGNRFLVDPTLISEFRAHLNVGQTLWPDNEAFRSLHGISDEAYEYLAQGNVDEFIQARHLNLADREATFLSELTKNVFGAVH